VSGDRLLGGIFGSKKDGLIRGWRNCIMKRFINCILCNQNDLVKAVEMSKAGSTIGDSYRILVGKLERKRPLGGPRGR
jgi:hypothetical protein